MKFTGYTNFYIGYRKINHTSSSHGEKILHKFLHCSVHSGISILNVIFIFFNQLIIVVIL